MCCCESNIFRDCLDQTASFIIYVLIICTIWIQNKVFINERSGRFFSSPPSQAHWSMRKCHVWDHVHGTHESLRGNQTEFKLYFSTICVFLVEWNLSRSHSLIFTRQSVRDSYLHIKNKDCTVKRNRDFTENIYNFLTVVPLVWKLHARL